MPDVLTDEELYGADPFTGLDTRTELEADTAPNRRFPQVTADRVLLPTGRVINLSDVDFNRVTYKFSYGTYDVTDLLTRSQKRSFAGFDDAVENLRTSSDNFKTRYGRDPQGPASTSVLDLWTGGMAADVAKATNATRSFFTGEDQPAGKTGSTFTQLLSKLWWLAIVIAVVAGLYFVFQIFRTAKG